MEPATDSTIVFEGEGGGLRQVGEVVKGFGSVVSRDISAEKSSVEGEPSGSISINQAVSFNVIVVDKKGNRVTSSPKGKGTIPFVVEVALNGNQQQQAKIEENQGKEGEFSVSFTPTAAGQHQISVSHKGRHFRGSPFRIEEMASLVTRLVLPAIQGVKSLLLSMAITECKYLTRQANSCSNSGQMEMEMGSLRIPVVLLLTRETTKLWLAIFPIIAFKYLMRRVCSFVPLGHQEMVMVN